MKILASNGYKRFQEANVPLTVDRETCWSCCRGYLLLRRKTLRKGTELAVNRSRKQKDVLVIGGYGAVGSAVCEELSRLFDGQILIAGRNLQQAKKLAQRLGERGEAVQLDATEPVTYQNLLDHVSVVVNCVEYNNVEIARACLARSTHYVEVSATFEILEQLQTLQQEAKLGNAMAVLSVGVAPGLTNLLALYAQSRLNQLSRAELFVLLGFSEKHGEAAIRWTLENLGQRFFVGLGGDRKEVYSFGEGRSVTLPKPFGKRIAYRFNFSDQHTLPATLGINSVNTWMCFDSRLATRFFSLMVNSGMASRLPLWRASRLVTALPRWFTLGTTRFVVQVDATAKDGKERSFALTGDGEARMTGIVAAHVAKHLLEAAGTPGIWHIEQILSLDRLLPAIGTRLSLIET
jgi:saccharopine dehydrogenase (NAD+, L-lysine forming)